MPKIYNMNRILLFEGDLCILLEYWTSLLCEQEMFQKHICPPWCKITTYMYKALWIQNFVQGRTKHNQIRVKDYSIMIKWQKS